MTNEELARKAKDGDRDALIELWEQNHGLAAYISRRRYNQQESHGRMCGVDMDDFMQTTFLALVKAVGYYDPEKAFSFNSYWTNCIKNEFNVLLGVRSTKRDALNFCVSIDRALTVDGDADDGTLKDMIPDPTDEMESSNERIYRSQVNDVLHREIDKLTPDQQRALHCRFWQGMTRARTAGIMGITIGKADELEHTAIHTLRRRLKGAFA